MFDRRILVVPLVLGLLVCASGWLSAAAPPRSAPALVLPDAAGAPVELAALKGNVVLVDFWASWCVSCKTSFPALDAIYREYQPRGFEVLAVNVDEKRRDAEAFLGARPHRLRVLFDPKGASAARFNVEGMPTSFLIDRAGIIRFTHVGYTGDVGASYRKEITQLLEEK